MNVRVKVLLKSSSVFGPALCFIIRGMLLVALVFLSLCTFCVIMIPRWSTTTISRQNLVGVSWQWHHVINNLWQWVLFFSYHRIILDDYSSYKPWQAYASMLCFNIFQLSFSNFLLTPCLWPSSAGRKTSGGRTLPERLRCTSWLDASSPVLGGMAFW